MLKTKVVILAAGKGKRMGLDIPKTLVSVGGSPMLSYILNSIYDSKVDEKPIIVVGHGCNEIMNIVGDNVQFVMQHEQLGTGHALRVAKDALSEAGQVIVLYGDHPFITKEMINNLALLSDKNEAPIVMATTVVEDYEDWRKIFFNFGRILRSEDGQIIGIKEKKDATESQLELREINPGFYCFKSQWLWSNIDKLGKNNAQGEYYLTDLIGLACQGGDQILSLNISPEESIGVNNSDELKVAENLICKKV